MDGVHRQTAEAACMIHHNLDVHVQLYNKMILEAANNMAS